MTPYYRLGYQPSYETQAPHPYDIQSPGIDFSRANRQVAGAQAPQGSQTQGFSTDQWTQGLTGLASMVGNTVGMGNQRLNLGGAPALQYGPGGQPSYDGSYQNQVSGTKIHNPNIGEHISGILNGAKTGAAIGGPVGAAIGAGVGEISTLIGGAARSRRQQRELDRAKQSASNMQNNYNVATKSFDQTQNANADYMRRSRRYDRYNNLYQIPSQYQ